MARERDSLGRWTADHGDGLTLGKVVGGLFVASAAVGLVTIAVRALTGKRVCVCKGDICVCADG